MASRTVTLCPHLAHGSFPFDTKQLHVSSDPVFLGSADQTGRQGEPSRKAESHNGWFGPKENPKSAGEGIYPLSLSGMHARIWANGSKVFIRDLETAFGTYVNGARIASDVELKSGDVVTLGSKIPRNSNTPAYITDDHLNPVIAVVTVI